MRTYAYIKRAVATLELPREYNLIKERELLDAHKKRFETRLRSDKIPYVIVSFVGKSPESIKLIRAYNNTTKITEI